MGRLVIAHHKSYHPYRRDNIEKVRKDEEEARLKEEKEEGRMMLADSEARIDHLRARIGGSAPQRRKGGDLGDSEDALITGGSTVHVGLPTSAGHINFFQDLEHSAIARVSKKKEPAESERGFALAPSAKDLKPWYSHGNSDHADEIEEERRKRDAARKSMNDPLTSITHQLTSQSESSSHNNGYRRPALPRPPADASMQPPALQSRLTRETSERQRALDLIRRKKREVEGSETPSSVHGSGYGDVFNRKEVEDAHRGRERRRDHAWDRGPGRRRNASWGDDDNRRSGGRGRQW